MNDWIVMTTDSCMSCKQLIKFMEGKSLNYRVKYHQSRFHESDPEFFQMMGVMQVPALVKVTRNRGFEEYKIVGIGFDACLRHIHSLDKGDEEE